MITVAAHAQQVIFGVKGGLNIAKMTNIDRANTRAAIHLGGFARVGLNGQWSIQPELVYSGQGYVIDPIIGDNYTVAVNYINLPIMAQYHIIPEFYVEAGPQLGFKVAAKVKEDGNSYDVGEGYKGVDFGLGFGLGYDFDFGLGVGARYNFGLTNAPESDNRHANSVAQFSVSYRFGNFRIKR